jgi:hypothetical protein
MPHLTTAKVVLIAASTAAGSAAAAIAAPSFNWNIVVAAIVGASVSSIISAAASIGVAVYLKRGPLEEIRSEVNHLTQARVDTEKEKGDLKVTIALAEGTATGIAQGLAQAKETASDVLIARDKKADEK